MPKDVRALFVTVDPERDTPAVLKDYLSSFDPRIIGVTGDEAAIAAAEKAYRVYAKKVPTDGGGYTMDHTAIVYLMNKDGRFVAPFNIKRRPEEAAADLEALSLNADARREVRASPCSVFSQRYGSRSKLKQRAPRRERQQQPIDRHQQQHPGAAEKPPPRQSDQPERRRDEIAGQQRRQRRSPAAVESCRRRPAARSQASKPSRATNSTWTSAASTVPPTRSWNTGEAAPAQVRGPAATASACAPSRSASSP